MQTTTSNALDIVPCIFGKECSGRHDAIYTHTRVNGAMFTGLVAKCPLRNTVYAYCLGGKWTLTYTEEPEDPSPRSRRISSWTSGVNGSPSRRRVSQLFCVICNRSAAVKCSNDPPACIHHCTRGRCAATGHTSAYLRRARAEDARIIRLEVTALDSDTQEPLRSAAVFHIVHRDRLDFTALYGWELDQLGISELVPSTIQVFDPAVENFSAAWKPAFDMQFNVQNLEAVLIRGVSKTSFPLQYVVDMASGMNAALKAIERSTDHDMIHLFAHHFPQCHQPGVDAFLAAILMWSEVSDEQKSHYAALGRTTAGQWKSLLAASHQRTSTPA